MLVLTIRPRRRGGAPAPGAARSLRRGGSRLRISYLVVLGVLGLLAWRFLWHGEARREYSTRSAEAYDHYREGEALLHAFRFREAEDVLRRSLQEDPSFAMAQASLAVALGHGGLWEPAERAAARAESLATLLDDPEERGLVLLRLSMNGLPSGCDGDSLLVILARRLPEHPLVLTARAQRAMNQQKGEEAEALWRHLLEIDPNQARAYNWLGYNAAAMNHYEEALAHLQKYAFLAPDLANPHDSLGEILSYLGRYEEAEREFRQALELQPDFYFSLLNLARIYVEQGRVDTALKICDKLHEQVAETAIDPRIDQLLIRLFHQQEMRQRLLQALRDYIARHPENQLVPYYRAVLAVYAGHTARGQAMLDSFLVKQRKDLAGPSSAAKEASLAHLQHSYAACAAEIQGDWQAAAESRRAAIESMRGFPLYLLFGDFVRYGNALLHLQRSGEALAQADLVLQVNPRWIPALLLRARALVQLQRFEDATQAIDFLQAALSSAQPDFPAVARTDSLRRVVAQSAYTSLKK
jgi:tetratricopeptide (TPR) repeat protein